MKMRTTHLLAISLLVCFAANSGLRGEERNTAAFRTPREQQRLLDRFVAGGELCEVRELSAVEEFLSETAEKIVRREIKAGLEGHSIHAAGHAVEHAEHHADWLHHGAHAAHGLHLAEHALKGSHKTSWLLRGAGRTAARLGGRVALPLAIAVETYSAGDTAYRLFSGQLSRREFLRRGSDTAIFAVFTGGGAAVGGVVGFFGGAGVGAVPGAVAGAQVGALIAVPMQFLKDQGLDWYFASIDAQRQWKIDQAVDRSLYELYGMQPPELTPPAAAK